MENEYCVLHAEDFCVEEKLSVRVVEMMSDVTDQSANFHQREESETNIKSVDNVLESFFTDEDAANLCKSPDALNATFSKCCHKAPTTDASNNRQRLCRMEFSDPVNDEFRLQYLQGCDLTKDISTDAETFQQLIISEKYNSVETDSGSIIFRQCCEKGGMMDSTKSAAGLQSSTHIFTHASNKGLTLSSAYFSLLHVLASLSMLRVLTSCSVMHWLTYLLLLVPVSRAVFLVRPFVKLPITVEKPKHNFWPYVPVSVDGQYSF
jgi:hypothetical protein